jgi:tRNA-dihydrouridine synthase B
MDRAVEHVGAERAASYLRKFYPWYVERLGVVGAREPAELRALQAALLLAPTVDAARALVRAVPLTAAAA